MKSIVYTAIAASALAALCSPASAHIVLQEKQAQQGTTYRGVLVVGHGCGSEATTAVRVQIPEGFYNVKPMPKSGWELETVTGPYETPFINHGTTLNEGVKEIRWTGGTLPNEFFDEFTFRGSFGSGVATDQPFYFPVIQTCGETEDAWIDTSGDDEVEFPAPAVTLAPAEAATEGHGHEHAPTDQDAPAAHAH